MTSVPADASVVTAPHASALRPAWLLRVLSWLLEAGLWLVVAGSVAAIGSVHAWAYVPLWWTGLGLSALLALRALAIGRLRRLIGPHRFGFDAGNRRLVFEERSSYGLRTWSFDLSEPLLPAAPLLLPGCVFLLWVGFQLLPLPPALLALLRPGHSGPVASGWQPLSVGSSDTMRGAFFVGAALLLHAVAAATLGRPEAGRRFRRFAVVLGLLLAALALAQAASGTRLIYGVFQPLEGDAAAFGPFVNRNHFAGYMLLIVPLAFGRCARAWQRYNGRVGRRPNWRRRLIALQSPEGSRLVYASIPAVATAAALVASGSRGGLLALVGSLLLAGVALRRRSGLAAWFFAFVLVGTVVSWWGFEQVGERLARAPGDRGSRTVVWRDSLTRLDGLWLAGSGFNTFAPAMSRVGAWTLPEGASAWPGWFDPAAAARSGFRTPAGLDGLAWYREAHNDYLQLLVETGAVGLLLALWGVVRLWRATFADPWLLAAPVGVLLHSLVDFPLQIPAVAVLFVVVAGLVPDRRGASDQAGGKRESYAAGLAEVKAPAPQ
jgi:hypothetical protein